MRRRRDKEPIHWYTEIYRWIEFMDPAAGSNRLFGDGDGPGMRYPRRGGGRTSEGRRSSRSGLTSSDAVPSAGTCDHVNYTSGSGSRRLHHETQQERRAAGGSYAEITENLNAAQHAPGNGLHEEFRQQMTAAGMSPDDIERNLNSLMSTMMLANEEAEPQFQAALEQLDMRDHQILAEAGVSRQEFTRGNIAGSQSSVEAPSAHGQHLMSGALPNAGSSSSDIRARQAQTAWSFDRLAPAEVGPSADVDFLAYAPGLQSLLRGGKSHEVLLKFRDAGPEDDIEPELEVRVLSEWPRLRGILPAEFVDKQLWSDVERMTLQEDPGTALETQIRVHNGQVTRG